MIPDEILRAANMSAAQLQQEIALLLFQQDKLTLGQASAFAQMSQLEFQRLLAKSNMGLPIIFISGHSDISISVQAMKLGAIEFLTKPLREQELVDAVQFGISRDRARRQELHLLAGLKERLQSLTQREREVFELVITGRQSKIIAADLKLSIMTVKVHRSHVMRKMGARSLIDLARMANSLGIPAQD